MSTINYTVRLDESDKKAAEHVFNELGLTLAAGFNIYIKAVGRQRKIPFDLSLNPPQNERLTAAQRKVANEFLENIRLLREMGFSEEDENKIEELQKRIFAPMFEERL
ncbi:MAG: type II toxin-antitoxin system RelB/DinJ family antitoxin [Defluviitaleaceae bacterium]|nr:type II toxin-antitoxin system RelB/DinJ family antitoxin [Defluviitaleaceae bacterium]